MLASIGIATSRRSVEIRKGKFSSFIQRAFGQIGVLTPAEARRRLHVWMDIEEDPAVQVDLAMDKDSNLQIGASTQDECNPQAVVQSNLQQEAVDGVSSELMRLYKLKCGSEPSGDDPGAIKYLESIRFIREFLLSE